MQPKLPLRRLALAFVLLTAAPAATAADLVMPALPTASTPPSDADREAASAAYDAASKDFYRGRFAAALAHADAAWAAVPNANSALVRGTILGELARPCDAFEALLLAHDLDPTASERDRIRVGLATHGAACRDGLGWLTLDVQPATARAQVAGADVTPGRTVGLPAGPHRLDLSAPDHQPRSDVIEIVTGAPARASFALSRIVVVERRVVVPAPLPPVEPDPIVVAPEPPPEPGSATGGWTLLTAGSVALAAGGVLYGLALDSADEAGGLSAPRDDLDEPERIRRYNALADDTHDYQSAGVIALAVGGAAVAGGLVWILLHDDAATSAQVIPTASTRGGGVTLGVSF